ncbi:MAG: DUF370 domain-containing protein [Clostridiales bacterium]|nr:DUF370 domain-containing protein [Clostridiales bacterium]
MYLHLGSDTVVRSDEIVGIFDLDNTTVQKSTRDYLARVQKEGGVIDVTMELPKSFVLCQAQGEGERVYLSQISSTTLLKRAKLADWTND